MHRIVWLLAVRLTVSACTDDRAEPAPAKPTRSAEPPPLVEPLVIADKPQWQDNTFSLDGKGHPRYR
jgi:hypothetical protein